jgi:6-pyruvoyltetrahydropterin/6-carboxytetrahydropterin synthase
METSRFVQERRLTDRRAPEPLYRSTKTYGHNEGLSCCFRQWRATHSHCRLVHGYSLSFHFVFATRLLDERNWCLDFGAMKPMRAWLHEMYDHTTLVAVDDPHLVDFHRMSELGLIDLRVLPAVGCEAVARQTFEHAQNFARTQTDGRVWAESVEVREHEGNSASYSNG